jgi:hypothetical protein
MCERCYVVWRVVSIGAGVVSIGIGVVHVFFLQLVLSCSVAKLRSNTTTTMCKAILSFYKLRHLIGHCKFDNQGMLHLRVSFHREFGLECGWINSRGQL